MSNKPKKNPLIPRFLLFILFITTVVLFGFTFYSKLIPTKYLLILTGVYILILLILSIFVFYKKIKLRYKVISSIVAILLIFINGVGINYLIHTISFLDVIVNKEYEIENFVVVVEEDSDYATLDSLTDATIASYNSPFSHDTAAKEELDKLLTYTDVAYDNLFELPDKLYNGRVDALLISESSYAALKELDTSVEDDTRILKTFQVKTEKKTDSSKQVNVTQQPFNVYISGVDTFGAITTTSRSDVNIIMTVNPITKEILLTTIPRDYYVQLHGTTGDKDKLTHAGIYGVDMSVLTIEDLLDIEINYYLRVNFSTLVDLVDKIGGITVDSDYAFRSSLNAGPEIYKFVEGPNKLNGTQALSFSRERKNLPYGLGDRGRGMNQQKVLSAIITKMTTSTALITNYSDILNTLKDSFQTNMSTDDITQLIRFQLDKMPGWTITSISLDGENSNGYTYSIPGLELYVMEPDEDSIIEASKMINELLNKTGEETEKE